MGGLKSVLMGFRAIDCLLNGTRKFNVVIVRRDFHGKDDSIAKQAATSVADGRKRSHLLEQL